MPKLLTPPVGNADTHRLELDERPALAKVGSFLMDCVPFMSPSKPHVSRVVEIRGTVKISPALIEFDSIDQVPLYIQQNYMGPTPKITMEIDGYILYGVWTTPDRRRYQPGLVFDCEVDHFKKL